MMTFDIHLRLSAAFAREWSDSQFRAKDRALDCKRNQPLNTLRKASTLIMHLSNPVIHTCATELLYAEWRVFRHCKGKDLWTLRAEIPAEHNSFSTRAFTMHYRCSLRWVVLHFSMELAAPICFATHSATEL